MNLLLRGASLAGLATLGVVTVAAYPSGITPAPVVVTSDTGEYCRQLVGLVEDLVRSNVIISPGAARLAEDGRHRCLLGQVRQGILHLREAVLMIRPSGPKR